MIKENSKRNPQKSSKRTFTRTFLRLNRGYPRFRELIENKSVHLPPYPLKRVMMKKSIWSICLLCLLFTGLSSCDDDPYDSRTAEEATYALCSATWVDYFVTDDGLDCEQQLRFYANGEGEDYRIYYYPNGREQTENVPFYWGWEPGNYYFDALSIDYPNGETTYLEDIWISGNRLDCLYNGEQVSFRAY